MFSCLGNTINLRQKQIVTRFYLTIDTVLEPMRDVIALLKYS